MHLKTYLVSIFFAGIFAVSGLLSCRNSGESGSNSYSPNGPNAYVGTSQCIECHTREFELWKNSHHDWAMRKPNDSTVLGDFNNALFTADGVAYRFRTEDDVFRVTVEDSDGTPEDFEIAYTFGAFPLQQYLVRFDDGKYQTLRASWDSAKNEWFHQSAGVEVDPTDWLHWKRGGQNWNTMCAECHSTNLRKNYDVERDAFNTTYSEINVACESCHGMGAHHVAWARDPGNDEDPAIDVHGIYQPQQINQCAVCHSRRTKVTANYEPGEAYHNQYILQTISSEYYYPDGQILEEDYVLGSFFQSKMYQQGVRCTDCHDPHSLQLRFEGNGLCMQCHEASYDSPQHHFHEQGTEASTVYQLPHDRACIHGQ